MAPSFRHTLLAALLAVAIGPALTIAVVTWLVPRLSPGDPRASLLVIVVVDGLLILAAITFAWRMAQALAHPLNRLREGAALMRTAGPGRRLDLPPDPDLAEIAGHLNAFADRAEAAEAVLGRQALTMLGDGAFVDITTPRPGVAAAPDASLADLTFVVLDLETTGLEPARGDRVVSIGAVRVRGGRVDRDDQFVTLVDPECPIPAASTRIHGIDDAMVRGQPRLPDVLPKLAEYVDGSIVVGHILSFDLAFLTPGLEARGLPPLHQHGALDTLLLAHALLPTSIGQSAISRSAPGTSPPTAVSLDDLAGLLGVELVGRHTALGDAVTTARVFVRLLALMEQRGIRHLGEALALQSPSIVRRVLDALLSGR